MPAEIVNSAFCASYWSSYEVPGSVPGEVYRVTWYGSECPPTCWNLTRNEPCKGMQMRGECRHANQTIREGCFWNPQWYEGGTRKLKPVSGPTRRQTTGERCPKCRGPMVGVRIAI